MAEELQLTRLQRERMVWVAHNFPESENIEGAIFGAVEEIGELAHHYLKMSQGIRGDKEFHRREMLDAVADCVVFLAGVPHYLGSDFGNLVEETWARVQQRDWIKYPENGVDK